MQMNKAFVDIAAPFGGGGIGDMRNNPAAKLAPLHSFTNTDSAGGEACDNLDDELKEQAKCD